MIVMRLNNQTKEKSPMNTITAGVDLAKLVFSICMVDAFGHVLQRKDLKRAEFAAWLAQVPAGTVIAMEACSGAHHWGRRCLEYGLVPRLMAAKLVKPYRKSQKTKNDRNDAEAIATAARQGNMRFVALKLIDQQARLSWHRVREGYKTEGLAIGNRLRGLLAEFGVIVGKGDRALREMLGDTKAMAALPVMLVEALDDLNQHWQRVCDRLAACSKRIEVHANADERCKRMRMLIGIGPITADAIVATVGSACLRRIPPAATIAWARSVAMATPTCARCSSRAHAAACREPRRSAGTRPPTSSCGSWTSPPASRSARCSLPSPTNMRGNCG
jgi:transposase